MSIFPSIEDQLVRIGSKFSRDISSSVEKKQGKTNFDTEAMKNLLTRFPHEYSSYSKCVADFVDVGRNSPNAAIEVLLKILPLRARCDLYHRTMPKITLSDQYESLLDLFFMLFFADCVAQIMPKNYEGKYTDSLILIGYKTAAKFSEKYEEPFRIQIVKQFSVIFSLLSQTRLSTLIDKFVADHSKHDIGLVILLNRYIRLTASKETPFEKINLFITTYSNYGESLKKDRRSQDIWAMSCCSLFSQLTGEGATQAEKSLHKVYKIAYKMASDVNTVKWYLMLCSIIIIRLPSLYDAEFESFFKDRVLKKKDREQKAEACLNSFLIIIRGQKISKGTMFWEWGSYNANACPGIEASFIFKPEQKQDEKDSFTQKFFKYFVKEQAIERFPDVVGEILVNFASRDFQYFMLSTIPNFIEILGKERSLLSLQNCLSKLVDSKLKFAQWAQNSPLNKGRRMEELIPNLFVSVKAFLIQSFDTVVKKEVLSHDAYCFELSESQSVPVFQLPFSTSPIPDQTKLRISESMQAVGKALEDWEFKDENLGYSLTNDYSTYENASKEEIDTIKILEFLPRILTSKDLTAGDRIGLLINTALSSSRSVSFFAIRIINYFFIQNESSRLLIYESILNRISSTQDRHHVFILLQFIVKLLEFNLPPKADKAKIEEFVVKCQVIFIYTLCFPVVEIRELAIQLIEKINKLASGFQIDVPLYDKINESASAIAHAARHRIYIQNAIRLDSPPLSDHIISFVEAATARYERLYQYYLEEAMCSIQKIDCSKVLLETSSVIENAIKLIDNGKSPCGKDSQTISFYQNLVLTLTHLSPILDTSATINLKAQTNPDQMVANYRNQVIFKAINDTIQTKLAGVHTSTVALLRRFISYINNQEDSTKTNTIISSFFDHAHWTILSSVMPDLLETMNKLDLTNFDFLMTLTNIMLSIAVNENLNLILAAEKENQKCKYPSKMAFITYFTAAEAFFLKHKVNGRRRFDDQSQMDTAELKQLMPLCKNYCKIMALFLNGLVTFKSNQTEGAISNQKINPWLMDKTNASEKLEWKKENMWLNDHKKTSLSYLINWSKFIETEDSTFIELAQLSQTAILAFVRSVPIFSTSYNMPADLESILINLENEGRNALRYILASHYEYMMPVFISYSYNAPPELAPLFFKAVCHQFTSSDKDNRKTMIDQLSHIFTSNIRKGTLSISAMGASFKRMARQTKTSSEPETLSQEDIEINKRFAQDSGKYVLISLIYLLHESYEIRSTSFRFLQRLAPCVHHILNPTGDKETGAFIRELNKFAASFYSTHITITIKTVMNVAKLFAKFLPQITEVLVSVAFTHLTTSAKGSFMNQSTKAILLQITSEFMINTNLECAHDWPDCFIIYTPFSLLNALLDILPSIDAGSMSYYLDLWNGLASTEKSISLVVDFLINASHDVLNEKSVKVVLLHLYTSHECAFSKLILSKLTEQLSFARWWNAGIQSCCTSDFPPNTPGIQSSIAILKTLTDLAQTSVEELLPFLHLILNFSLLFFDNEPALIAELLLVILWGIQGCPDSLTSIFLPPCSLVWSRTQGIEFPSQMLQEASAKLFTLKGAKKDPVSVVDFVNQFVSFLRKHDYESIADKWGEECLRWASGCGDLLIASRASLMFSGILHPFTEDQSKAVLNAMRTVMSAKTNEQRRFYICSTLQLFEHFIDKNSENENIDKYLSIIASTCIQLLQMSDEEMICSSAIALVAKYILYGKPKEEEIYDIICKIAPLFGYIKNQKSLCGCVMAIFSHYKDTKSSTLPITLFVLYLPTIYKMFGAWQNIQPFSSSVTNDSDIGPVLESSMLAAQCACFPSEFAEFIATSITSPSLQFGTEASKSANPESFVLGTILRLCMYSKAAVFESAPLLYSILIASPPDLTAAVFTIVNGIIENTSCIEAVGSFSSIVEYSTKIASLEASHVQETYLRVTSDIDAKNITIPPTPFKVVKKQKWTKIIPTLPKVQYDQKFSGDCKLEEPIPMAPLDQELWISEAAQAARAATQEIIVQPFTAIQNEMDKSKNQTLSHTNGDIKVDTVINNYLNYKNFIREEEQK
jgi:hypothetical protein